MRATPAPRISTPASRPLPRCLVLATIVAAGGCATHGPSLDTLPARDFTGHFTATPGASWFQPCTAAPADSAWWVTLTGTSGNAVDSARAANGIAAGQPVFVRWEAALTTGGEIGPRGRGAPALLVRKLLALRPAAASDCSPGGAR